MQSSRGCAHCRTFRQRSSSCKAGRGFMVLLCFCQGGGLVNVNIGWALGLGSSWLCARKSAACHRACSCADQCVDATYRSVSAHGGTYRGLSGCMQNMIRTEGRGLCCDRVTAAGGAECVVVPVRMLSAAPPADGDRPALPTS